MFLFCLFMSGIIKQAYLFELSWDSQNQSLKLTTIALSAFKYSTNIQEGNLLVHIWFLIKHKQWENQK